MNPIKTLFLIFSASSAPLGAVVVIHDSFSGMANGDGLNGRTPETNLVGGNWIGPTGNFLSDGAGSVLGDLTQNQAAFIDLGSGFMAANPGLYTLTAAVTVPSANNNSFVGIGFTPSHNVNSDIVANARPMIWHRQNGQVTVLAGGSARPASNISSSTHGSPAGSEATLKLILDASNPSQYYFTAFIDNYEFDLNGTTAGTAYEFGVSTPQRYIALTSYNNNVSGTPEAMISSFSLDFTAVPEPSTALLGIAGITLACLRRTRATSLP